MAQITLNSSGVASNGTLALQSNGTTTAVTVDTAQNVGVGTTPSAWGSTAKAVQLPNGCAIANLGAGDVAVTQNAYFDNPNFKYASTTGVGSSVYRQIDGTHRWSYAASGTAGNNITFTEAMRIDSSGNVLVGTTTPYVVSGGGTSKQTVTYDQNDRTQVSITNSNSGSSASAALVLASYGTDWVVGNGSTANNSGALTFTRNSTERMRIDSSGNLLVGTTGQIGTEKIGVEQTSTTGQAVYCYAANASYAGNVIVVNTARAASTAFTSIATYSAGVNQFYVGGTGLIYSVQLAGGATTLSVNASGQIIRTPSDASLKTNVQPITYGLDTVMKLKPIKHDWVEEINMGAPSIGFIAQDMELEVPEVVSGEEYKSIDYPKLTAVLTKAIQEQQALITQLQADVAALKGNA